MSANRQRGPAGLKGARRVAVMAAAGLVTSLIVAVPAHAGTYYVSGPNMALATNGGHVEVSSQLGGYPASALNDGIRQTRVAYWNDATNSQFPDWAQLVWSAPITVSEVVLRMPVADHLSAPQRTLGPIEVSRWDAAAGSWATIVPTNGADNPISSWTAPATADGSQIKVLDFDPVETDKIRVTLAGGNSDGWSFMEEIEAYNRMPAQAPFKLITLDGTSSILQPNDVTGIRVRVTDAQGYPVAGYPVTFAKLTDEGGAVLATDQDPSTPGLQVLTDTSGEAGTDVRLAPSPGMNQFVASTPTQKSKVVFRLEALSLDQALRKSTNWLESQAGTLEAGSRIASTDGGMMYTPDGVGSYHAFWPRDFAYMVEGYPHGIPVDDIRAGIEYLMRAQRADGAMPDHVEANGDPQYCPGSDFCGTYGPEPTADNSQFMVKLAYDYWQLTGDLSLFREHADGLIRAMNFTRRSPDNSLVYITPARSGSPYGFTDSIVKTGDLLFSSLLYYEAAGNLAEMLAAIGDDSPAAHWRTEAAQVKADVQTLYDSQSGMFLAASIDNRQIDIWGSAFAAHLGVATDSQQQRIAHYLKDNYHGLVLRGQVRHTAPGTFWQRALSGPGTYQNGPYWATPSGWVAMTIAKIDRPLAQQMLVDMTKDFMANGINEYFNNDPQLVGVRKYVASATNPIPAMKALSHD